MKVNLQIPSYILRTEGALIGLVHATYGTTCAPLAAGSVSRSMVHKLQLVDIIIF